MKNKKVIVLGLAAAMLLSLTGCGKKIENISLGDDSVTTDPVVESETEEVDSEDVVVEGDRNVTNIMVIPINESVTTEAGHTVTTTAVSLSDDPDYEFDYDLYVDIDGTSTRVAYGEWLAYSYLVEYEDGTFALLSTLCYSNDWTETVYCYYDVSGTLQVYNTVSGCVYSADDIIGTQVFINSRYDIFGTYGTKVLYSFAGTELKQVDPYLVFVVEELDPTGHYYDYYPDSEFVREAYDEYGRQMLITKQSFTGYNVSTGDEVVIPADARIYPTGVNPDEYIFYFGYEGEACYVIYEYDEEEWRRMIDGIDEYDLFVLLPYAG